MRYWGPDNGSAYVTLPNGHPAVGRVAEAYADEAGTVLADILDGDRDTQGDPVDSVTTDAYGRLGFWFPDDQPVVWVTVNNGPLARVTADMQDQLDDVVLGGGGGGGLTEAEAQVLIDASVATHTADTTAVHGIADTSVLESTTGAQAKATAAQAAATAAAAVDATTKANAAQAAAIGTASADATTKANAAQAAAATDATGKANTAQANAIATAAGDATAKVATHAAASDPHGDRAYADAALLNKADLVLGVIPTSQIPAYAVTDVFTAANQVAMLALTAQRGDMAIRTDTGHRFVLSTEPASTLGNWVDLGAATDAVSSVNGQTGVVVLGKTDVGLSNVDNTTDLGKPISTATQTALNAKQPLDQDLTDIAALASADDSVMQRKAGAWTGRTLAQLKTDLALAIADVASLQATLDAKQPLDSDLTTIAGLTPTTNNFLVSVASAWASRTPAQVKTTLAIAEGDVTNLTTDLAAKAALAGPTFTGVPAAPTPAQGTNTTQLATTAYVQTEAGLLVPKSLVDAKGDLLVGSANDTVARLAVGSDGQVLTADAASTNGVKWAAGGGGGGADFKIAAYPKTGLWYRAPQIGPPNSSTNLTMTLNVLYLVPFRVGLGFTIDRIGFELVTVGGATAVVRYGIFNVETTNYLPSTLVFDSGTAAFTITAGTGSKVATISQALTTGSIYWFGLVTQVASGAVVRATVSNDPLVPYFSGAAAITGTEGAGCVIATGVSGALASNPTISNNDRGPILSVRSA